MKSIDMSMKGYGGMSEPVMADKDDTHYPEFHYCGDQEIDLPDEGVMEIRFKKVSEEERNTNGKKRYSFSICVCEILEVEGKEEVESPATSGTAKNTEQALDKILKTMQDMVDKDEDTHERMDKIMDIAEEEEGEEE